MQFLVRETVDPDLDALAGLNPRQLRLLVIGYHIDLRQRHHGDEVAADIDIVARLHLPLADHAIVAAVASPNNRRSRRI
jgi:hypothetical protein